MSWSLSSRLGKAAAVRAAVAKEIASSTGKCSEPEETIRQQAFQIIDAALAAQNPNTVLEFSASGSMSTSNGEVVSNTLNIKIEPKWGFLE